MIDLPLIRAQIDSCFMSPTGEDIEASRGFAINTQLSFFISNQPKIMGLCMYWKKGSKTMAESSSPNS